MIELPCSCGKSLRVKDELAGKRVRCPDCKAVSEVPVPRPQTGCFCGHVIEFTPAEAGSTRTCPNCERPIFLSDPSLGIELEVDTEAADPWPHCAACGARLVDSDLRECPSCGANARTGEINYRKGIKVGRRIRRTPQAQRTGPPVARIAGAEPPAAAPAASKKATRPPPAALPPHDSSHVDWRDSKPAQAAEEFAEELEGEDPALDFMPGSLAILDFHFAEHRREGAIVSEFLVATAHYLGEVITRNLGGRWRRAKDGREVIAHLPGGASFDPLSQVKKRVPEDSGTFVQLYLELVGQLGLKT